MPGIFISYRRADSDGWAGRLRDALRTRFGDLVFQDVDNIADGEIFSDVIDRALQECDVALIIIGPSWGNARDDQGKRRLDNEDDWVRTETAMVLNRKIRVIPVLVGGATLPRPEDLPEELRSLTKRQAREIRSNSWDSDVALLSNHLEQIVGHHRKRPMWLYVAPAAAVAVAVGIFAGSRLLAPTASPPTAPPTEPIDSAAVVKPPPAVPIKREDALEQEARIAQAAKEKADRAREAEIEQRQRAREVPAAESPKPPRPAQAASDAQKSKPAAPSKSASSRPPATESAPAAAAPEPRPAKPAIAAAPQPRPAPPAAVAEPRRPPVAPADAETPSERIAAAPSPAPKTATPPAARTNAINLPNRPASSRELKVGDSWTYRLREVRFNKNLATVTHEIGGGDSGGIRETVRIGESKAAGTTVTERRMPLEPRMFEQQLDQNATLYEFAPFMTAFSDLQPGVKWARIATAANADSNDWRYSGKVAGREAVRVPAGSFEAIKAELEGQRDISFPTTRDMYNETIPAYQTYSIWFVPEIGRAVKYERRTYNRARRLLEHEQYELMSYQAK